MDLGARLLEVGSDAVLRARWSDGRVLAASADLARLLGERALVGRTLDEVLGEGAFSSLRELLKDRSHAQIARRPLRGAGGERAVRLDAYRDEDALDVLVRDLAGEDEAEPERRWRAVLAAMPDLMFVNDARTGVYTDYRAASRGDLAAAPEYFLGKRPDEVLRPDVGKAFAEAIQRAMETRSPQLLEYSLELQGATRFFEARVVPCGEAEALSIVREITDRKRAEQALANEKERLAVTLSSIGDAVIATDELGRVVLVNPVAEALTGWTQAGAAGRPLDEVFRIVSERTREPMRNPVEHVLSSGAVVGLANDTVLVSRDGSERAIADSGAPIRDRSGRAVGVVLVFRDQTEKKRLDAEMRRIDKLESVALLAGGIAHDFNNILAAIVGNLSFARQKIDASGELTEILASTEEAALRATGLTRQLLAFSGRQQPVMRPAALGPLVREWSAFALSGTSHRCDIRIPSDLWPVRADETQLGQAVSNLVINAAQAMEGGGTIEIEAGNVTLAGEGPPPLPPGPYVRLTVRDTGAGILPEHLPRIFDPFFTTKQRGHGLGLATAHAIVQSHGGHMGVESRPGEGATFTVHLPASPGVTVPAKSRVEMGSGAGRVLVMDDDPLVRRAIVRMLKAIGYECATAPEGGEAIRLYGEALAEGRRFVAVIADLTVSGGMGGMDMAARLKDLDPGARVVASTGYSTESIASDLRAHGFRAALAKPYDVKELAAVLSAALKEP